MHAEAVAGRCFERRRGLAWLFAQGVGRPRRQPDVLIAEGLGSRCPEADDGQGPLRSGARSWLDSWRGIRAVGVGMYRQGYDLQLMQYDERAGERRSMRPDRAVATSGTASAWEPAPWRAVKSRARDTEEGGPISKL